MGIDRQSIQCRAWFLGAGDAVIHVLAGHRPAILCV